MTKREIIFEQIKGLKVDTYIHIITKDLNRFSGKFVKYNEYTNQTSNDIGLVIDSNGDKSEIMLSDIQSLI